MSLLSSTSQTALDAMNRYYEAFNAGDHAGMIALLADDVAHDTNQGTRETGKEKFAAFLKRMNECYEEQLSDLVLWVDGHGTRAAAEFTVLGKYVRTDEGLPAATGQTYTLPAGAFFSLDRGLITRVTMYYNLADWLRQVGAEPGSFRL